MTDPDNILLEITPQVLLKAYSCGIFPMAETADNPEIYWVEPEYRGIIPLDDFNISRSLQKTIRKNLFEVRIDTAFKEVVDACAEVTPERGKTWINDRIKQLYNELHLLGYCHSVECWQDNQLVGGLYGVHLGRAFFGESMFSRVTDSSKVALVHLVDRMKRGGFCLLDTQFTTEHLKTFGAIDVYKEDYLHALETALVGEANFFV